MGRTVSAAVSAVSFVAVLWAVHVLNVGMGGYLSNFGVHPRDLWGLIGVPLSPFIHGSWEHLIANSTLALVLVFLLYLGGNNHAWRASSIIVLVSGLGTWLIANPLTVHIGASGLIFGWLTFLIFRGWYSRSVWQMLVGAFVLFSYGSVLWGVFPSTVGISWQMHLFGAIGGIIAARSIGTDIREQRQQQQRVEKQRQQQLRAQQLGGTSGYYGQSHHHGQWG